MKTTVVIITLLFLGSITQAYSSRATTETTSIDSIYQAYVALKDALVAGKAATVPALATRLANSLDGVSTPAAEKAAAHATKLASKKSIADQRSKFVLLSEAMFVVAKANPPSATLYYQRCPMYNKGKGGHWLSAEKEIRNPYYGETMLTCGSTVETLEGK